MDCAFDGFDVLKIMLKLVSVFLLFRDYLKIIFKMKRVLKSEIICRLSADYLQIIYRLSVKWTRGFDTCVKNADYLHRLSVKWVRGFDTCVIYADYLR